MCIGVEGVDLYPLLVLRDGFVVLALPLVGHAQRVIGESVVGVIFDLLLVSVDRLIGLSQTHVGVAQVVPGVLVLRVELGCALQQFDS